MNHAQPSLEPGHAVPNGVHDTINGDQTSELVAVPGVNGILHKINGSASHNLLSPAADSPATPTSSAPPPDVKIDLDYQEQESDVRHEPMEIKHIESFEKLENASIVPQVGTPVDPTSNGTPLPPTGVLLEDVNMEELPTPPQVNGINGTSTPQTSNQSDDVVMADAGATHTNVQADASISSVDERSTSYNSPRDHPHPGEDDDGQPPTKRARIIADPGTASLSYSATPPPVSASVSNAASPIPPPPSTSAASMSTVVPPTPTNIGTQQFRFCQSSLRSMKKLKEAAPFLRPVDPVALNIPHYLSIIKNPMDFSTIERKLNSSNPAKPDANPENPRYYNVDEFVVDVRLIFSNCLTFNGPDHAIVQMGKRVSEFFDKNLKSMPTASEPKPTTVKKAATPPPPPPPPPPVTAPLTAKKTQPARRASMSVPVIRRSDVAEAAGRPKREIHPPPPKDLPYADVPKKNRKGKRIQDDGTAEQFKYCAKILQDLHRKQHYAVASPFFEPVDWVKLDIPSYPRIIKKPMDMSTMKKKLENNEYPTAQRFFEDFKLMIRNCFAFNPSGTPVCQAGVELQRIFDEKWKHLPPLHPQQASEDDDEEEEEEEDSEAERQRAIAMMESQIETMRGNLAALKGATKPPKEKKKKEKKKEPLSAPSTSKSTTKQPKAPSKKKNKKPIADDDVLTFEQKKDLSETIGKLEGVKLEKVINIIHEGVPEIRDSTEEIELEIDLLPAAVLTKLYNFVIRPIRQPAVKRNRTGKGTGTGGLKRKSMDEDVEAEKIRQLEKRMLLFDQGASGAPQARRADDSEHSSDSSSGSDSSGSDSE